MGFVIQPGTLSHTVLTYGILYRIIYYMKTEQKVTVMLPTALVQKALKASGEGLTPTLRRGLELVAAKEAYRGLLKLKGKFPLSQDYEQVRRDRE
jgi:hypothetical protein